MPPAEQNFKILLVEDNKQVAIVHKRMLEELNCTVDMAEDGNIAFFMAQKKDFDLIFMDLGLPELDGYDATIKILKLEKCKKIPIIGLTAENVGEAKQKCLLAGMKDIIGKPTTPEILNLIIKGCLKNK